MAISVNRSNRLQLIYDKGTYSFTKFASSANNTQLYNMAVLLNMFQDEPVKKIRQIRQMQIF